jgi:hypothetical protein
LTQTVTPAKPLPSENGSLVKRTPVPESTQKATESSEKNENETVTKSTPIPVLPKNTPAAAESDRTVIELD